MIACIGLGAAATASVVTLVGATLLRPLPFPAAERLTRIWLEEPGVNPRGSLSIPDLQELSRLACFDVVLATARSRIVAIFDTGVHRMRGEGVTPGYFEALGLSAERGRLLAAEDHRPDAPRVVVLSHASWLKLYGGAADVVGQALRTERTVAVVVGVAPRGFNGTVEDDVVEFWTPLSQYEPAALREDRRSRPGWAVGRLREGTSVEAARAEVGALFGSLRERHPDVYRRLLPRLEPMGENWRAGLRPSGLALSGASALLLLVAATNVAGLLLARVLDRRKELAVRSALGADRRRLVRQLLLEALLLVGAGGLVGTLAGPALLEAFLALSPVALPSYVQVKPDALAFLISFLALAATALVAGIAPALAGSRVSPSEVLKDGARGTVGHRTERSVGALLVAAETALTLTLLVGGGLLLRSWQRLERAEVGYRTEGIARLAVTLSRQDVPETAGMSAFQRRLGAELALEPGVDGVGFVWPTLPPWDGQRARVRYDGLAPALEDDGLEVGLHVADAGLLPMLGVPVVAGRNLEPADGPAGDAVAVVSRALAERMGGVDQVLGRRIELPPRGSDPSGAFRIVGVAENVAYEGLWEQDSRRFVRYGAADDARGARFDVYLSLARFPMRTVSIGVHTRGAASAAIDRLRRRIAAVAPTSAVHWTSTMQDELAIEFAPSRFYALLVTAFSASALLLTGVGLFAVLSHGVARRTAEIGLRVALGAGPRDVARLVLGSGLGALGLGLCAGSAGAATLGLFSGSLLYDVRPLDTVAFVGATLLLLLVALPASLLPARRAARRAARLDPMRALHEE